MITEKDEKIVEDIINFLYLTSNIENNEDWDKKYVWSDTLNKLVLNLKKAPYCYKPLTKEDKEDGYFYAECKECGWEGCSKYLNGGEAIADTGDYFDVCCPVCGNDDI